MKKIIALLLFMSFSYTSAQHSREEVLKYQEDLKTFYSTKETSPLKEEEFENFKGLTFYPFSKDNIVNADVEYLVDEPVFLMATTGTKEQEYKRYAILHFELSNKKYQLEVYQNILLIQKEAYKDHLFLPFLDNTNGKTTAEVGRYMDIKIPLNQKQVVLNFNLAYHPYCAYTHGYSCPITPFVNLIDVEIEAGIKY